MLMKLTHGICFVIFRQNNKSTKAAHKVSILSHFMRNVFCTKVFCTAFLWLQFGFVIFWCKNIGVKTARKIFMKLTTWVISLQ